MMLRALAAVAGIYVLYACVFFLIQRAILYPGRRLGPGPSWSDERRMGRVETIELDAEAGPVRAWFLPARPERSVGAGALVFHGNAEVAVDLIPALGGLSELGVSTLFVEFPGFAGEPGRPTEASILNVATEAYDWLTARADVDEAKIFAVGRSLGTGAAAGLTLRRRVRALVLWSPFVSVGYLALHRYGLPPFLALDRFDSRAALRSYGGPVLIFHGTRDGVIPFRNAEVLAKTAAEARLVTWSCGHSDCPPEWDELWEPLGRFLAAAELIPADELP